MRKIITLLVLCYFYFFGIFVFAQNITPESSSTPKINVSSADQKSIETLKEKVASKVSELLKKNNKAIIGRLIDKTDNLLKIKDNSNQIYEIRIDDTLTKFYKILGTTQKEIKINDLEKNDYLIVVGITTDKTVDANAIFVDKPYLVESGKVMEIDKENYVLKIITADKTVYNLSIETFTKQYILNIKTLAVEKTGFSKIIIGDRIHFVAEIKGDEKDNTYQAQKILIIPQEYFIK
ncbi:MAG: hypothetical protein Fur009_2680 [Candidatus Microgenomates bacterium]